MSSLLAANCMCSWAPYLFDCKPRLIQFFSSFHATYNQGRLTFLFFYFRERYRSVLFNLFCYGAPL